MGNAQWVGLIGAVTGTAFGATASLLTSAIQRRWNKNDFEHETRFGRLHEKRIDAVLLLYESLEKTELAFQQLMKPGWFDWEPPIKELRQKAYESASELQKNYSYKSKLLLPRDVCHVVESFLDKLWDCWKTFPHGVAEGINSTGHGSAVEAWDHVWKTVRDELPTVRAVLEAHFRRMLGSDDGIPLHARREAAPKKQLSVQ